MWQIKVCFVSVLLGLGIAASSLQAEELPGTPPDPVAGKWVWKMAGSTQLVIINADGTATASGGGHGTWLNLPVNPSEQRKYRVLWQDGLFVNTVRMASPDRIEGKSGKNEAIIATRAPVLTRQAAPSPGGTPDPLLGKWVWKKVGPEILVTFSADGTAISSNGYHGVWEYQPEKFGGGEGRKYLILWQDGLYADSIKFTGTDKFEGRSKEGDQVMTDRILGKRAGAN